MGFFHAGNKLCFDGVKKKNDIEQKVVRNGVIDLKMSLFVASL